MGKINQDTLLVIFIIAFILFYVILTTLPAYEGLKIKDECENKCISQNKFLTKHNVYGKFVECQCFNFTTQEYSKEYIKKE